MAETETSYFNLRPCDKEIGLTDPKPHTNIPSDNTCADTGYLHDLGLPSLPPLSQLLTSDDKAATIPACTQDMSTTSVPDPVVQAIQQQLYSTNNSLSPVHTSLTATPESSMVSAMTDSMGLMAPTPATTAPLSMLIDPAMYPTELSGPDIMLPTAPFYSIAPSTTSLTTSSSPPDSTLMDPHDSAEKNYSFVAIPGANQRKRPRRRYDEIERLYHCTWPNCTKSYGTLNHLNAHVSMQKHGPKRHPSEFKEMRKNWRRQKKEREAAKKAASKESLAMPMMQPLQSYNPPFYASFPPSTISAFY